MNEAKGCKAGFIYAKQLVGYTVQIENKAVLVYQMFNKILQQRVFLSHNLQAMRFFLILTILISAATVKAQSYLPLNFMDYSQRAAFAHHNRGNDSIADKKWFVSTYAGVSTSFTFYRGGNATIFSAPLSLQLNRRLNNNLYAFAAVSAAPAYVNFNNTFLTTDVNKFNQQNSFYKTNSVGLYSRVDVGLTYINDAKTFSISGSIGIERSNYPAFPYNQVNTSKQNHIIAPNR